MLTFVLTVVLLVYPNSGAREAHAQTLPRSERGTAASETPDTSTTAERSLHLLSGATTLPMGYVLPVVPVPAPPTRTASGMTAAPAFSLSLLPSSSATLSAAPRTVVSSISDPEGGAGGMRAGGCPIAVRGIVMGERVRDSFVLAGVGDQSVLLHVGESVRTAQGRWIVQSVRAGHIVLRQGEQASRCVLSR